LERTEGSAQLRLEQPGSRLEEPRRRKADTALRSSQDTRAVDFTVFQVLRSEICLSEWKGFDFCPNGDLDSKTQESSHVIASAVSDALHDALLVEQLERCRDECDTRRVPARGWGFRPAWVQE
jgi:hypothetical protein